MKTKLKIAVITMMGLGLSLKADNNLKKANHSSSKINTSDKIYFNTNISNNYVKIYQITTKSGQLASNVRISATSHGASHVGNFTAEILVNHHKDVFIKTTAGAYTQGVIKIESDDNGNYFMSYKSDSPSAAKYYFTVEALSSEITINPLPTGQAPNKTVHEHRTKFGTYESGTGGTLNTVFTNNVGIGTSNPKADLHINNGNNSYGAILANADEEKFSLYTKTLTTQPANIESFRLGLKYDTDERNGFISFYRGSSGAGGFLGFSTLGEERVRISSDGNVGIGTSTPSFKLDISAEGSLQNAFKVGTDHADGGKIYTSYELGSAYLNFVEYDDPFVLNFIQTVDGGITEKIYYHKGKFGIGTRTTGSHKLAVEGSIGAREIKVEANTWSDFVFYDDYQLPTLKEVENHINEKGHLKDIPSAKEVEENGIFLGEMDAKLLQKIEELTLYTIAQDKEIKELKKQNSKIEKLEKENILLKSLLDRVSKIEKQLNQKN
ncbi:hypothetical protein [Tenacibaculum sp. M341]|uniref:hypothetical protein n=1 Tax=Tenacibaculum sp. M341 TaxID=2530339 RepID=UPI001042F1BD|nr:hypothetical protein [Tenacibaculum sp. M341]TCI93727.1 hypothetical protein EYW44_04740 [Tenacibaculum sp. M341]